MGKKHSPQFEKISAAARTKISEISVDDLKARLDSEKSFHLIDVREQYEWDDGHIQQAKHLSKGVIERDIEIAIPNFDAEIICYCGGGYRSALVAVNLEQMGYTQILSLAGGYRGWCDADHPVTR